ncbi:MAG: acyltransferase family protein [Burkholderiaceae bacterium]
MVELDSLRGLAAIVVVLFHYIDKYGETVGHVSEPLFWVPWGTNGVRLFFIISGFVIFMTLERTRRPMDFLVSRFARLYPAYWTALALTFAVVLLSPTDLWKPTGVEALVNTTMWQSLFHVRDVEGAYWTLYVELCFYAVMLALFTFGQLKRIDRWLALALAVVWAFWLGQYLHGEFGWSWLLTATFGKVIPEIPFFVIGVCLYRIQQAERVDQSIWFMLAALVTIALLKEPLDAATALAGIIAFAFIFSGRAALLRIPPLVWLGSISYSLYLIHNRAGRALIHALQQDGWSANASILLVTLLAIGVAAAITYLIERPAQRAIRRWYRQRGTPAAVAVEPRAPV